MCHRIGSEVPHKLRRELHANVYNKYCTSMMNYGTYLQELRIYISNTGSELSSCDRLPENYQLDGASEVDMLIARPLANHQYFAESCWKEGRTTIRSTMDFRFERTNICSFAETIILPRANIPRELSSRMGTP